MGKNGKGNVSVDSVASALMELPEVRKVEQGKRWDGYSKCPVLVQIFRPHRSSPPTGCAVYCRNKGKQYVLRVSPTGSVEDLKDALDKHVSENYG